MVVGLREREAGGWHVTYELEGDEIRSHLTIQKEGKRYPLYSSPIPCDGVLRTALPYNVTSYNGKIHLWYFPFQVGVRPDLLVPKHIRNNKRWEAFIYGGCVSCREIAVEIQRVLGSDCIIHDIADKRCAMTALYKHVRSVPSVIDWESGRMYDGLDSIRMLLRKLSSGNDV